MIDYKIIRFANARMNGAQFKVFTELLFGWDYVVSNAIRTEYTHSAAQLATATHQSEKTVRTAVKELERMGWITVNRQRQSDKLNETNGYSINVERITMMMNGNVEDTVKLTPPPTVNITEIKNNNESNDKAVKVTEGNGKRTNTPSYEKRGEIFKTINAALAQMSRSQSENEWNELNDSIQSAIENARSTFRNETEFEVFKQRNESKAATIRAKVQPTWETTVQDDELEEIFGEIRVIENTDKHSSTFKAVQEKLTEKILKLRFQGIPTACIVPSLMDELANTDDLQSGERKELEQWLYKEAC